MKKTLLAIALITLLAGCQQGGQQAQQEEPAADPNAITCDGIGPVKESNTHADLETLVGSGNLEDSTKNVNGNTVHVTRVFPNEAKEITVYWAESQPPYATITKLVISNSFGPYQTAEGLKVGSTLDDLRKQNNFMPITMTNFYNSIDGFATITGFNGGDIEVNYPCLGGRLDIVKQRGVDVRILDEIQNNETLQSSHKLFSVLDVSVVELSIQ